MNATVRRVATPAVIGTALAATLGSGVALAHYRSNVGTSGTGSASTASVSGPFTLTVTGTVSTGLYPGGPGADVTVAVTNPFSRPLSVRSFFATAIAPVAGCTTTGLTVASPTNLPVTVPVGSSPTSITFNDLVKMGTSASNGCQGAAFTITFQATGQM